MMIDDQLDDDLDDSISNGTMTREIMDLNNNKRAMRSIDRSMKEKIIFIITTHDDVRISFIHHNNILAWKNSLGSRWKFIIKLIVIVVVTGFVGGKTIYYSGNTQQRY